MIRFTICYKFNLNLNSNLKSKLHFFLSFQIHFSSIELKCCMLYKVFFSLFCILLILPPHQPGPGEYNVSPRFYGLLGTTVCALPIVGWVTLVYDNKRLPLNGLGIPQRYPICTAVSPSGWPSLRSH